MNCNQEPVKFVNCCDVMDCIDIHSSDESVQVVKDECGVDLTINANTLDTILQVNNSQCITWIKEFIQGKLVLTPQLNIACLAALICVSCTCPAPLELEVSLAV